MSSNNSASFRGLAPRRALNPKSINRTHGEVTMERTHTPVAGSIRRSLPGAVATGPASANAVIEISLKLKRKQPLPPLTGRPEVAMPRQQLADDYGADQSDI